MRTVKRGSGEAIATLTADPPLPADNQELQRRRALVADFIRELAIVHHPCEAAREWADSENRRGEFRLTLAPAFELNESRIRDVTVQHRLITDLLSPIERHEWETYNAIDIEVSKSFDVAAADFTTGVLPLVVKGLKSRKMGKASMRDVEECVSQMVRQGFFAQLFHRTPGNYSPPITPAARAADLEEAVTYVGVRARMQWRLSTLRRLEQRILSRLNGNCGPSSPKIVAITKKDLATALRISATTLRGRLRQDISLVGELNSHAKVVRLNVEQPCFTERDRTAIQSKAR